jgi:hypothetical protein
VSGLGARSMQTVFSGKSVGGHSSQLLTKTPVPKAVQTLPLPSPRRTQPHVPSGQLGVHTGSQNGGCPAGTPCMHSSPSGQGGLHIGSPPPHRPSTHCSLAHWWLWLHLAPSGLLGLAQAMPGMEASAPPTRAAPTSLSALPRVTLPLASPLASSSKERSLASGDIGYIHSQKGRGQGKPRPVDQRSLVCRGTKAGATSENAVMAKFAE